MAETIAELVAKITTDATELKRGLADAERKTEASSRNMADAIKKVSFAFTAIGGAVTASMGLMGKAAIDEEINIKHLQVALKGVGINYDDVKKSLEGVIAATQTKTGIADSQQRDTLSQLILVTKDYNKALQLLPLALDLAAFAQMDTRSAATYLAKAYEELEAGADKIGIRMGTTTVYFKDLNEVQQMVGGTAKQMVNPFNVLKASFGDLAEEIGASLVPVIKDFVDKALRVISLVRNWASENPELARTLTLTAVAIGGALTVIGALGLAIPPLVTGIKGLVTVFGALRLVTFEWTAIALGVVAALYSIRVIVGQLKGEFDSTPNITYFEVIKKDVASLMGKVNELLPQMTSLDESTNKITVTTKDLAKAYDPELVASQDKVRRSAEKLEQEQDDLNRRFQDLMYQIYYTEGASAKYRITIDDVYRAMYRLGYTTEQIQAKFKIYGSETNYTDILLGDLGITAERVADVLGLLKDNTDKNTTALDNMGKAAKRMGQEVEDAARKAAQAVQGVVVPAPGGGTTQIWTTPWGTIVGTGERALGPGLPGQRPEFIGGIGLTGRYFAEGGIVTQPTLGMVGEAGPEAVIPLNEMGGMGGVTVNFTQPVFFDREDTMNKFVAMIRKGIQRQDRQRFGAAYNG